MNVTSYTLQPSEIEAAWTTVCLSMQQGHTLQPVDCEIIAVAILKSLEQLRYDPLTYDTRMSIDNARKTLCHAVEICAAMASDHQAALNAPLYPRPAGTRLRQPPSSANDLTPYLTLLAEDDKRVVAYRVKGVRRRIFIGIYPSIRRLASNHRVTAVPKPVLDNMLRNGYLEALNSNRHPYEVFGLSDLGLEQVQTTGAAL